MGDSAMTSGERMLNAAHVLWARLLYTVGWQGVIGAGLILASMLLQASSHRTLQSAAQLRVGLPRAIKHDTTVSAPDKPIHLLPGLPASANTPLLLKEIQQATQAQGLAWPYATYQYAPLTDDTLATLEIQTTLKGPYVKIKKVVSTLLRDQPALAMREFTVTRPNADTTDVEAKVRWAVFLSDGWVPGLPAAGARGKAP
jgi:Tfp pilus assembly protein PilO